MTGAGQGTPGPFNRTCLEKLKEQRPLSTKQHPAEPETASACRGRRLRRDAAFLLPGLLGCSPRGQPGPQLAPDPRLAPDPCLQLFGLKQKENYRDILYV